MAALAVVLAVAGCGGGGSGDARPAAPAAGSSAQANPVEDFALAQQSVSTTAGTVTPLASGNMLSNPGFENGTAGWVDWGNTGVATGQASTGNAALRLGSAAGGAGQEIAGIVPGHRYRLRAQAKVSAASEIAYIGVNFTDASGAPFTQNSVLVSSTAYTTASLDVVAPPDAARALVYVWKNAGSGQAFVDDFALQDAGDAPPALASSGNLVANGGFEGGLAGWMDWGNTDRSMPAAAGIFATQVGTGAGGFGQDVRGIVAGSSYRVSAQARVSDPGETGYLGVMFMDDAGTGLLAQNAVFRSTTYASVQADVTAPAGATKAQVFVWKNAGEGFVHVDEVALVQVAPATAAPGAPVVLANVNSIARGVAVLNSGMRVAAWSDDAGVHSQRFDVRGSPVGSATSIAASGTFTGVAALAGGGYVIEYSQPGVVLVQVMDATGALAGAPAVVRTQAQVEAQSAGLRDPALAGGAGVYPLGDGGFAAQYRESHVVTVPGDFPISLMARRFDALGNALGAPAALASEIPGRPATSASTPGGGLATAATLLCPCAGSGLAQVTVRDAALQSQGGYQSPPFDQTTAQGGVGLGNGNYIAIWTTIPSGPQAPQVKGQVFAPQAGSVTPVLTFANAGAGARVTALAGGGFLLSWGDFAQAFDANAQPQGAVLQILDGSIAATPDGGFVVVAQVGMQLVEQQYRVGI